MPNDSSTQNSQYGINAGQPEMQNSEVSLRDLFDFLKAGKWTIAFITVALMTLAGLFCILVAPSYQADGLVQVEEDSKSGAMSSMSDLSSLFLGTPVETAAEIEILKSRMVLGQVIRKENLEVEARPRNFPIIGGAIARLNYGSPEPAHAFPGLRRFAWGGEQITVSTLDVPAGYIGKTLTLVVSADGYELHDPDDQTILTGKVGQLVLGKSQKGPVSIFVQNLVAWPGTQFRLTRYDFPTVLKRLSDKLLVAERGVQSGVIGISFAGKSPAFVANVINDIENAYLRQNVERRSADAQQSLEFLEKQLPSLKGKLDEAQARLTSYQIAHGSVDVTQETQLVLQQNVDLETQRLQLEQQREQALQRYTPQHPFIKGLDQQIQSLDDALEKVKGQAGKLPSSQQEVLSLLRDQDVNVQLYTAMLNSIQELQVAKAGTVGNVRIVDYAMEPTRPYSPKPSLMLALSMILGLVFGVAYIFIQRALLRGVDDPAQIERTFGLPVIASIPFVREQRGLDRAIYGSKSGNHILAMADSENIAVEALRSLRTSLHFALLEARNNVIMFTGPSPGLGKSFLTSNLGAVLAASGKKVAVLDADLRRGHLHQYVGAPVSPGVSDYIAGSMEIGSLIRSSGLDNLTFISRGSSPPNPAELLLHERFALLVSELSKTNDYVLIDTPPVLAVADASIVGKLAGSALLVLKSAHHPVREIEESIKRMSASGIRPRGIIMNQVGLKAGSYGRGNYGYTYYRYESK